MGFLSLPEIQCQECHHQHHPSQVYSHQVQYEECHHDGPSKVYPPQAQFAPEGKQWNAIINI